MMRYTQRLIIVISADIQAKANAWAKNIDPDGGENTFNVPVYRVGLPQITPDGFWCSWAMTIDEDTNIKSLRDKMSALDRDKIRIFNGNTRTPESVLAELGLETWKDTV